MIYNRYSTNGKPYKLNHTDYLGAKGIGLIRVATPVGEVDVYSTHLHASYILESHLADQKHDEYLACRVAQAFECAKFVEATRRSRLLVLMGDFNSTSDSTCIKLQSAIVEGLRDAFAELHPQADGFTFSTHDNPFTKGKNIT